MPPQPIGWTFAKTGRQRAIEDKRGIVQIAAQKNIRELRCNGKTIASQFYYSLNACSLVARTRAGTPMLPYRH